MRLSEGLRDAETPNEWAIQRRLIEGVDPQSLALYPALEEIAADRSLDQLRGSSAPTAPAGRPVR